MATTTSKTSKATGRTARKATTSKASQPGTARLSGSARTAAAKSVVSQRDRKGMSWRDIANGLPGGPYAPRTARALYDEVKGAGAHHHLLPGKGGRRPVSVPTAKATKATPKATATTARKGQAKASK